MSEKFVWQPGDLKHVRPRQCSQCKHLRDGGRWTCDAFPSGIPSAILTNKFDHTKPYPGDRGIRFERRVDQ